MCGPPTARHSITHCTSTQYHRRIEVEKCNVRGNQYSTISYYSPCHSLSPIATTRLSQCILSFPRNSEENQRIPGFLSSVSRRRRHGGALSEGNSVHLLSHKAPCHRVKAIENPKVSDTTDLVELQSFRVFRGIFLGIPRNFKRITFGHSHTDL